MISNASKQVKSVILLPVVGVIVHLSPHCAFMFDSFLFGMCLFMSATAVFPGGIVSVVEPALLSVSPCRATRAIQAGEGLSARPGVCLLLHEAHAFNRFMCLAAL